MLLAKKMEVVFSEEMQATLKGCLVSSLPDIHIFLDCTHLITKKKSKHTEGFSMASKRWGRVYGREEGRGRQECAV